MIKKHFHGYNKSDLVKVLIVISILIFHFVVRYGIETNYPLQKRHFYSRDYSPALALLDGHGLKGISIDPTIQEHRPINDYLNLKKSELEAEELNVFFSSAIEYRPLNVYEGGRSFELLVAAGIWKLFGVSWHSIFVFYIGLSTLACLSIFFLALQLTQSFGCAVLGAVFFSLIPSEMAHMVWSIRDINPTWFLIFSVTFCFCAVGKYRTRWGNALSYFSLGVISLLGLGWRPDAMIIPIIVFMGLLIVLFRKKRKRMHIMGALILFFVGAGLVNYTLNKIANQPETSKLTVFHVSVYADSIRSNVGKYENHFQMIRDDITVKRNADRWAARDDIGYVESSLYGKTCLKMFLAETQYNIFNWVNFFPILWGKTVWEHVGLSYGNLHRGAWNYNAFPEFVHKTGFIIEKIISLTAVYVFLGLLAAWVYTPFFKESCLLLLFSFYYALIYWVMLPEIKHITPLALPSAIFFALCCLLIKNLCSHKGGFTLKKHFQSNWKVAVSIILLLISSYFVVREFARIYSTSERDKYLAEIHKRAAISQSHNEIIKEPEKAVISFPAKTLLSDKGYVLQIKNHRKEPGLIEYWELRGDPHKSIPGAISAKHTFMLPSRIEKMYFYTTCTQFSTVRQIIDPRPLHIVVRIPSGTEFISAKSLDLDGWHILPYTTLFYDGQKSSGAATIELDALATQLIPPPEGWIELLYGVTPQIIKSFQFHNGIVYSDTIKILSGKIAVYGEAGSAYSYLALWNQKRLKKGVYLIAKGRLNQGGLTLGLLKNNNTEWAAQQNITQKGHFEMTIPAPLDGKYSVVLANCLADESLKNDFVIDEIGWSK